MKFRDADPMLENDLIAACLRGDGEEYRKIVDMYKSALMAAALNILGNREDAEDVCQETFVQAYRHLHRFDARLSFKNWLYMILYRRCLDQVKKKRRFQRALERAGKEAPLSAVPASSNPGRGRIAAEMVRHLSPNERTALTLWANEGFTSAEISEVLSCSASTARVYLYSARKKIKSLLEKSHASSETD
jgi:RNA polymerase sigma-70 factor (ECF subfamily)